MSDGDESKDATGKRRHARVANVSEVSARQRSKGTRYAATVRALSDHTGSTALGCNLYEVPQGCSAVPFHFHCGIEEGIYVLEGSARLRIGQDVVDVGAGDWITFPPGPAHAHQLMNTGATVLRYLCFSNKSVADVVGYPDSKKIAALASPSPDFVTGTWVRAIYKEGTEVDYFEGEITE